MVPALVIVLGIATIAGISMVQQRSVASRDAQLKLAHVKIELNQLQTAPFQASPTTGGSPRVARKLMATGKQRIAGTLAELRGEAPPPELQRVSRPLRRNFADLGKIYAIGASGRAYGRRADRLAGTSRAFAAEASALLDSAAQSYDARASRSQMEASVVSGAAILLLLAAFSLFYRRSARARSTAEALVRENKRLLAASRVEALSDSLTGLRNRRALMNDIAAHLEDTTEDRPMVLALFDLDGFKQYNDTFGHQAGDALLTRLGERLEMATDGRALAYRMGGDEFCVLGRAGNDRGASTVSLASAALSAVGDAFEIGSSHGVAHLPAEATTGAEALRLADQRMYAHKAGRASARRQSTDVLLQVLSERSLDLHRRPGDVDRLARLTAESFHLPEHEVKRIELAAELHDVGKTAIPDAILNKPGGLDAEEWEFVRGHTLVGERIVRAAPSLAHAADLVRSCHERPDGAGYPDGLVAEQIPLGASIIAVAAAFHAMVSDRPYQEAMEVDAALAELRRCSGTQFDPQVVENFCVLAPEGHGAVLGVA
jgi:diguanylate cyclase (GGDEF)-like protein